VFKSDSIFLKCQCGGCSLLEMNCDNEESQQFNVSIWKSHPGTRILSIKERIRWCWHILFKGNPWADHTILSKKDALKLSSFIIKHSKSTNKYEKTKR
jgi:hypothetical protein